jgi:hypothetical protein
MAFSPGPLRRVSPDVQIGRGVRICDFVNLYGCTIGDGTKLGVLVEIQKGVATSAGPVVVTIGDR